MLLQLYVLLQLLYLNFQKGIQTILHVYYIHIITNIIRTHHIDYYSTYTCINSLPLDLRNLQQYLTQNSQHILSIINLY